MEVALSREISGYASDGNAPFPPIAWIIGLDGGRNLQRSSAVIEDFRRSYPAGVHSTLARPPFDQTNEELADLCPNKREDVRAFEAASFVKLFHLRDGGA